MKKAKIERLRKDVEFLCKIRPYRNYRNLESLEKACRHISGEFARHGFKPVEQAWEAEGNTYKNIIASYLEEKDRRLIIGAHYDVAGDQEGADDNASAVAGLLETARLLSENRPELDYGIDLVAYNLEEAPFFTTEKMGSFIHAKSLHDSGVNVLCLILSLLRHIPQADASMRAGQWDRKKYSGTELKGKTLGIIGFGRVGRALSQRAQAFGVTEVAYDPFVPENIARHLGLSLMPSLDALLERADIISLHAQATDDTRGLINKDTIAKMKNGVYIVNAARGALINNADLAEALKSGKVAGAALDVYDEEPPSPENPLIGLPNVICTPHLGASTDEAQIAVGVQAAEEVVAALFKKEYDNVRNKAVLEKLG